MPNIKYIHRGKLESRILEIEYDEGKKFSTPTYFPAISSAATRIQLESLIQLCTSKNYPRLLVSAYDLHYSQNRKKSIISNLKNYMKNNFLFVDSGTFESYWLNDNTWNYNKYNKIIKELSGDFYTSFDEIPRPDDTFTKILEKVNNYAKKSKNISKSRFCATVIHGNTSSQLIKVVEDLSKNNNKNLSMLAIPERDCGKTIQEKIITIQKIRRIISKDNPTNILHILGCGNPLSIAMFSFAGADSFDSIDWSRWTINPKTLQFMDLNHIDLINCPCDFCKRKNLDSITKALLHNLLFYQKFIDEIQTTILNDKDLGFLKKYVDRKTFSKIVKFF